MWGSNEIEWVVNGNVNNAGGVITMWRKSCFHLSTVFNGSNYSIIAGEWRLEDPIQTVVVNIYNTGSVLEKKAIWGEVREKRSMINTNVWCVVGDFNSIRCPGERRNVGCNVDHNSEMRRFNEFIKSSELIDLPMLGRKFTWYKPNGLIKSRIDRFLVSREWLDRWSDSKYRVLDMAVSDHYALVLDTVTVDWGSKPFCCLDVWHKDNRFREFVRNRWLSYEIQGGGLFVFKEKLKLLKADLKEWNKEVFGNVFQQGDEIQKRIHELDAKDDESELDEVGREERKWLLAELRSNNLSQEAIYQQKARIKWLKQGDLNTKYFHSTIKWRRARNGFNGVRDNGVWYENQGEVKDKVRMYFKERFSGDDRLSVKLDNASFNRISEEDNIGLVGRISDEEVKEAVWSCDSDKSPGPDGFNLALSSYVGRR